MMHNKGFHRKSYIKEGEIYFWTATINNWQKLLIKDSFKDVIIQSLTYLSNSGKIEVFAFVIMPNHIHIIWRIREKNGNEIPHASFLKYTAHCFKKLLPPAELINYKVNASNKQYEFWKRDSLAIEIINKEMAYQKLNYLHANPVAEHWMLVKDAVDYKYSTAAYYEKRVKEFLFIKDLRNEF